MTFLGEPPEHIKLWIKDDFDRKGPLFFEANEAGASVRMLCWDENSSKNIALKCHLQYSIDKMSTWATYDGSTVYLDGCTDNRVYFRADPENPNTYGFHKEDYDHGEVWTHYFKTVKSVKAGGNIQFLLESTGTRMDVPENGFQYLFGYEEYDEETGEYAYSCSSLMSAPSLPATALASYCYYYMFQGCTSLTTAPSLPATALANYCYANMFKGCTSLTTALALPATTLTDYCYNGMFYGCSSLTTAPSLPATALASYCYYYMFQGCTSLVQAPALPATILAGSCYSGMFQGCTSLVQAPALPATILAGSCYYHMFKGCTSLVQAPALPATTLASYCYSGMFRDCAHLNSMDVSFTAWSPSNATGGWVRSAGSEATGTKTFTCPDNLPRTYGSNNIPAGWTVI